MLIIKKISALKNILNKRKIDGKRVGFAPTMGALHSGHISLIQESQKKGCFTVCSIFVNPTQFNEKSDFENYPITIQKDIEMLEEANCDVLFLPSVKEIYPNGMKLKEKLDFGYVASVLEGAFRPGHFDGMAQVVRRLLEITEPDYLFMGQKDYQQQLIVAKMIKILNMKVKLIRCEILREKDGLAMSSRNVRLSTEARKLSAELNRTLKGVCKNFQLNLSDELRDKAFNKLKKKSGIETEYLTILDSRTLKKVSKSSKEAVVLVAARIGGVRLIDNMLIPIS